MHGIPLPKFKFNGPCIWGSDIVYQMVQYIHVYRYVSIPKPIPNYDNKLIVQFLGMVFQMKKEKDTLTATFTLTAQTFLLKIQFATVTSRNENFTVGHGNAKPRDVH